MASQKRNLHLGDRLSAKLAAIFFICISVMAWQASTAFATGGNHTITIDGSNDFAADEDVPGTSGSTWYFTWDATNFYFAVAASDVAANSATKWVWLYLDTDPKQTPLSGLGSSTGVNYNTQSPGLPFRADYHFRWKTDNTYTNMLDWNNGTNSWTDDNTGGGNFGIAAFQSGTFVEFKIPRASLGSPSQLYVCGAMINEQGFVESTFFMTPQSNGPDGYDKDFGHYFGFPLVDNITPDFSGNEDTYPVASIATGNYSSGATWTGGVAPHNNSNVFIQNGHTVTLDATSDTKHLTVISGGTFNGSSNTLNLANNGLLNNNGTFNAGTSTVVFGGVGTIAGTTAFNTVVMANGVNFGSSSTVNGTLQMNTGGFVATNAPTYGASSTLQYNTGGSYNASAEWTANASSGIGVPQNVQLSNNTTLALGSSNRTANGNLTIASGSTLTSTSGTLSIGGDFANNGTFMHNSGTVTFTGSGTKNVSGSSTTGFNNLTVNLGSSASVLDVLSPITMTTDGLTLTQGTFKLSSASTITPFAGATTIPSVAGFHLNHASAVSNWGSTGSLTLQGKLIIDAGAMTIGSASGNSLVYATGSMITIGGGSLAVAGRISSSTGAQTTTYTQTGGDVTILTVGSTSGTRAGFEMLSGSSLTMSGGTFTIERGNTGGAWDVDMQNAANKSITGGTFQFGNASTPAASPMTLLSQVPLYNLTINNAAGVTLQSDATINNTLNFIAGNLTTGALHAIIGSSGSVTRTSGHVVGNLRKSFAVGTNVARSFEIGTGADYTPVDINVANVSGAGTMTLSSSAGDHGSIGLSTLDANKSVNRRWNVSVSGLSITTYDATFNFVNSDLDVGVNTNALLVGKFSGGAWTYPTVGTRTATSTQATGLATFGEFQLAEPVTPPGVTIVESSGSTDVTEGGATDSYTIVLNTQPSANVMIAFNTGSQLQAISSVTFTSADWNTAQTITVTADDDNVVEGAHTGTITHAATSGDANYNGITIANVTANIADNDVAGVTITESSGSTDVTEGGATDSYSIVLNTQPSANVTIAFNTGSQLQAISSVTFTSADWNTAQTITVAADDDNAVEGAHTGMITHTATSGDANYNGITIASVTANITDNDVAGVTIVESSGSTDVTEGGATDSYSIVLNTQPSANVTIAFNTGSQLQAISSVTFTSADWNTAQTITVAADDDNAVEGAHTGTITHTATSGDANYNGITIASVTANITDNDVAGVTIVESSGSTDVTEGGATDSYSIVLNTQPSANVTIAFNTGSQLQAISSVTFTSADWNTAQTITVAADDDNVVEGAHTGTITHTATSGDANYNGITIASVTANIADNDNAVPLILTAEGPAGPLASGTPVVVTIKTAHFTNLGTLQFSMNWDPAELQLDSNTPLTIDDDTPVIGTPAAGQVTYSWLDGDIDYGVTLPDGTTILTLNFTILTPGPTSDVNVAITDDPTIVEASDSNFQIVPVTLENLVSFDVTAPIAVKPFVFVANKVTLKSTKQSAPSGDIHSNGTLVVEKGKPSTYNSNLTAVGKITINKQNTINGNVKSQTSVSNSGTITGTKSVGAVNNEALPSLSYTAGGADKTVPNGGSLTLAPGSYGIVTMSNGGTLKLTSGEYFMNELRYSSSIEGGTLEIDLSSGDPITINVVSSLLFGHEAAIVLLPNGESDSKLVTCNTLQSTSANWGREAYLLGNFNAPNAVVTLVKNSQLRGTICAKEILVSNDCLFLHHDSPGALPGPGNLPKSSFDDEEETDSDQSSVISYQLEQNYPNPFNPSTTISFQLPVASEVSLSIFNTNGQLVKKLVAGAMNAGQHTLVWDATNERGERVASGVYLYVIKAAEFTAQHKLVLLK